MTSRKYRQFLILPPPSLSLTHVLCLIHCCKKWLIPLPPFSWTSILYCQIVILTMLFKFNTIDCKKQHILRRYTTHLLSNYCQFRVYLSKKNLAYAQIIYEALQTIVKHKILYLISAFTIFLISIFKKVNLETLWSGIQSRMNSLPQTDMHSTEFYATGLLH